MKGLFPDLGVIYSKIPSSSVIRLGSSLDIVLSPHRAQFHLARCLARSKHGCDLIRHCTQLIILRLSSVMSVKLARCLNWTALLPFRTLRHRAKFWHSAWSMSQFRHRAFNEIFEFGESTMSKLGFRPQISEFLQGFKVFVVLSNVVLFRFLGCLTFLLRKSRFLFFDIIKQSVSMFGRKDSLR